MGVSDTKLQNASVSITKHVNIYTFSILWLLNGTDYNLKLNELENQNTSLTLIRLSIAAA